MTQADPLECWRAWFALRAGARDSVGSDLWELAGASVASVLTPQLSGSPQTIGPAGLLASQMVADVSAVDAGMRKAAAADLGSRLAPFVLAVWVRDLTARSSAATASLRVDLPASDPVGSEEPWALQDRFLRSVAVLDRLDPVTSEVSRLRTAAAHGCRICRSRRSRQATDKAGLPLLDAVEAGIRPTGLTEELSVAVDLVDAILWRPLIWPAELAARVERVFTPAQRSEMVLDFMRNSANKIAVALGADAARVDDGVEFYDIDPSTGELIVG